MEANKPLQGVIINERVIIKLHKIEKMFAIALIISR